MANPKNTALDFDPALIPSGTLWLPRASLSACLRGVMERNTVGRVERRPAPEPLSGHAAVQPELVVHRVQPHAGAGETQPDGAVF